MSAKGDVKQIVKSLRSRGFAVEQVGRTSVYEIRDNDVLIDKLSWSSDPGQSIKELRSRFRRRGFEL